MRAQTQHANPPYCPDTVEIHLGRGEYCTRMGLQIGHLLIRPPVLGLDVNMGKRFPEGPGYVLQFIDGGVCVWLRRLENALMLADDLSRFASRELVGIEQTSDLRTALGPVMYEWSTQVIKVDRANGRGLDWRTWCQQVGAYGGGSNARMV